MCQQCRLLIKAIDAYIAKADEDLSDTLGAEGYRKPKKTLYYAEAIEDDVNEALTEETEYFLEHFEESVDLEAFAQDVWPGIKLNDKLKRKLARIFRRWFTDFIPEFTGYYLSWTDKQLKLDRISRRTVAWVESWSEDLADLMQLNSHTEIENILKKGLEEGAGMPEFTRRILESGIRDERYRARRVAVTEVLRAHSVAQQEAFMQSPAVEEKMWKHTGDYRNEPRENHVEMNGERVPVPARFTLRGADGKTYYPLYPRDTILPAKESVNCHCLCQPVVSEDILGMSLEERQELQRKALEEMDDEWEKELDARNRAKAGIEVDDEEG